MFFNYSLFEACHSFRPTTRVKLWLLSTAGPSLHLSIFTSSEQCNYIQFIFHIFVFGKHEGLWSLCLVNWIHCLENQIEKTSSLSKAPWSNRFLHPMKFIIWCLVTKAEQSIHKWYQASQTKGISIDNKLWSSLHLEKIIHLK